VRLRGYQLTAKNSLTREKKLKQQS